MSADLYKPGSQLWAVLGPQASNERLMDLESIQQRTAEYE